MPRNGPFQFYNEFAANHEKDPTGYETLKKVLDDAPAAGIDPIDRWQQAELAGQPGEYYLLYFGKETPTNWIFELPNPKRGKDKADTGAKFTAEVLDTWAMTVTPVRGVFTLEKKDNYTWADKDSRSVSLPGKPYMAIRIKRVKE